MYTFREDLGASVGVCGFEFRFLVFGRFSRPINHHSAGKQDIFGAYIARKSADIRRALYVGPIVFPILMTGCGMDGRKVEDIKWSIATKRRRNWFCNIEINIVDAGDCKPRLRDINAVQSTIAIVSARRFKKWLPTKPAPRNTIATLSTAFTINL